MSAASPKETQKRDRSSEPARGRISASSLHPCHFACAPSVATATAWPLCRRSNRTACAGTGGGAGGGGGGGGRSLGGTTQGQPFGQPSRCCGVSGGATHSHPSISSALMAAWV